MKLEHPANPHIPGLHRLWQEAFGDEPAFIHCFFNTAFDPQRCLCLTDVEAVCAAAYWFDCEYDGRKAAYIYAVATAQAHRGQGLCRQLMDGIRELLTQRGYGCAILVPGDTGLAFMYSTMGYQFFGGMDLISSDAGETATPVTRISSEAYAPLRRQYLPRGGVVQEGENLAFLRHFAAFYQGEGFLMAASVANGKLFAAELLGSADPAGILAALGVSTGSFRVPGKAHFAMYLPLNHAEAPSHFGFAFD